MSDVYQLRETYARYSRRDFRIVDDTFAEEIEWRITGLEPLVGRDQVLALFEDVADRFAEHTILLDDAVAIADRVIAFVTHTLVRHDGERASFEAVHDWRFRDGMVQSLHEVVDTLAVATISGRVSLPV